MKLDNEILKRKIMARFKSLLITLVACTQSTPVVKKLIQCQSERKQKREIIVPRQRKVGSPAYCVGVAGARSPGSI